ncbi:MAG: hypothetical protein HYT62_01670 [Candidatus Yanofskybacteria bacterium]|nr:hypothetical protein [Candidatus Yanofskybacteria bacterium]
MTLFRRKSQPQSQSLALIQAPSADLIRGDNELVLPETYVPKHMDTEEFNAYQDLIGGRGKFDNVSFIHQDVIRILVNNNIRLYPGAKVNTLLEKQTSYYEKTAQRGNLQVLWRPITGISKYEEPIPARIMKLVKQLQRESDYCYFGGNCDPYGRFTISDISHPGVYRVIVDDKSLICFLGIELFATYGSCAGYEKRWTLIIDAWRGPTFSDEESYLPGQERV